MMREVGGPVRLYGVLSVFQQKLGCVVGVSHQAVYTSDC